MLTDLIKQIDDHLAWRAEQGRKLAETTFGMRAVKDSKLVARLKAGKGISVSTMVAIQDWIAKDRETLAALETHQDAA